MDGLDAHREEARRALDVAIAHMGTNVAKVEDAERRCDKAERQRDEAYNLFIMLASEQQKRDALVIAATLGIAPLVVRLIGAGVDPDSVGSDAIGLNLVWGLAEGATNSMGWDIESWEVRGLQGGTPLSAAIGANELEVLELLLDAGADIEMEAPGQRHRPLMHAAHSGRPACVRRLLEAEVEVDAVDHHRGHTALHRLADSRRHCPACLRRLLEAGIPVDALDHEGRTPLHCLADSSYSPLDPYMVCCVHLLLGRGADKDARTREGLTPLMLVAGRHDPDATVLEALLDNHADKTLTDGENRTALDIAVEAGNKNVAALLRHGVLAETARKALVLAVREFGVSKTLMQRAERQCAERNEAIDVLETMMTVEQMHHPQVRAAREACQHQRQQISSPQEALVERRPDATAGTGRLAVLLAWRALGVNAEYVEQADVEQVAQGKDLLDKMLTVLASTATDEQKGDALVHAALQGNRAAVRPLIVAGANPDHECTAGRGRLPHLFHPSQTGLTPLIAAINGGDQEVVNQVLQAGADIEKEHRFLRPLMCAASCYKVTPYNEACVRRLLDAGASVDAQCEDDGMCALHWAVLCGARDYLSEVEATDEDDRRVEAVVEMLLGAGANKALVNEDGETAAVIAEREGYEEAAWLLRG